MILFLVGIIGLITGSFINALVWRLHEQLDEEGNRKKLTKRRKAELSISTGRSMCPQCKHTLHAIDLVPVFSWLWLRGKCRYCKAPISKQYPLVEIITSVLFMVSFVFWPYELAEPWAVLLLVTWLSAVVGLVALAVYDSRWMLLPDVIIFKLYLLVFLSYMFQFALGRPIGPTVYSVFLGVVVGGGIFWLLYSISKGRWIGGGDIKLGYLLGALVGSGTRAFLVLFVASLLGLLWVIPMLMSKKTRANSQVPFGPFLIAAAFIVMLWGQVAIDWYTTTFLII